MSDSTHITVTAGCSLCVTAIGGLSVPTPGAESLLRRVAESILRSRKVSTLSRDVSMVRTVVAR